MLKHVVRRLTIDAEFNLVSPDGILVRWEIDTAVPASYHPLRHALLWSASPNGKMELVAETGEFTEYFDQARHTTRQQDIWYAVYTRDARGNEYFTPPYKMCEKWEPRQWRWAQQVLRQYQLKLDTAKLGVRCVLLRAITSGERCDYVSPEGTPCLDDADRVQLPSCPNCFGTGFTGGYYPALPVWIERNPAKKVIQLKSDQGMQAQDSLIFNISAFPAIRPSDFLIDVTTGIAWRIQSQIQNVAELDGRPLIQQASALSTPMSHPIYQFPFEA